MRLARGLTLALALLFGGLWPGTAVAESPWFLHPFGELRAYFSDWLVVCEDRGYGPCRAVNYQPDPAGDSTWGLARVALHHLPNGTYGIELYLRDMVAEKADPVRISIEDWAWDLAPSDWRPGELRVRNVLETLTLTDPVTTDELIGAMRAGDWMYVATGDGAQAEFSLRGVTAAILAMRAKADENAR